MRIFLGAEIVKDEDGNNRTNVNCFVNLDDAMKFVKEKEGRELFVVGEVVQIA